RVKSRSRFSQNFFESRCTCRAAAMALRMQRGINLRIDEAAQVACFASEVDGVEGLPRKDEEIEHGRIEDQGSRKDQRGKASDEAGRREAKGIHDGGGGKQSVDTV